MLQCVQHLGSVGKALIGRARQGFGQKGVKLRAVVRQGGQVRIALHPRSQQVELR
jgi:hypothetical protein